MHTSTVQVYAANARKLFLAQAAARKSCTSVAHAGMNFEIAPVSLRGSLCERPAYMRCSPGAALAEAAPLPRGTLPAAAPAPAAGACGRCSPHSDDRPACIQRACGTRQLGGWAEGGKCA